MRRPRRSGNVADRAKMLLTQNADHDNLSEHLVGDIGQKREFGFEIMRTQVQRFLVLIVRDEFAASATEFAFLWSQSHSFGRNRILLGINSAFSRDVGCH
jgi:hypothetical protein